MGYIACICRALAALLLGVGIAACAEEEAMGKATVTVTFTTRASTANAGGAASDLADNEQMRKLRVIVVKKEDSKIIYNETYVIEPQETRKVVTFSELTVKTDGEAFDFYAIANEQGTGNSVDWDGITVGQLESLKAQGTLDGTALLNAAALATMNGQVDKEGTIPQTGFKTITVVPQAGGGIQQEEIQLQFVVAKVRLTVRHTNTKAAESVTDIKVSGVNQVSTPFFPLEEGDALSAEKDGTLWNGTDAQGATLTAPAFNEAEDGEFASASLVGYVYENTGGEYKLTATWGGKDRQITFANYGITEMPRGTLVDITVTLATEDFQFNVLVRKWGGKTIDVPPFE